MDNDDDIDNPTVPHVTLYIKLDNVYLPVLSIPRPAITHYALKPYKWLRFLGFILYGDTEPGFIAVSENEEQFPDDQINGNELEHSDIYYVPSGQHRMVDTAIPRSRHGSVASSRNPDIANLARQRDEDSCVLSGFSLFDTLEVCHLLPHAKGNSYIDYVTSISNPGATNGLDVEIDDIDDIRNQITMHVGLHRLLDSKQLAFLLTPNVLLDRADIPQPTFTSSSRRQPDAHDTTHLTAHYFPYNLNLKHGILHSDHNSDLWQPMDKSNWPTRTILNFTYASAVFNRWGRRFGKEFMQKAVKKYTEIGQVQARDQELKTKERLRNQELDNLKRADCLEIRSARKAAAAVHTDADHNDHSVLNDHSDHSMSDDHSLLDNLDYTQDMHIRLMRYKYMIGDTTPLPFITRWDLENSELENSELENRVDAWRSQVTPD